MKYSDHRLWRIYENVAAVVGWVAIAALAWIAGGIFFPDSMPNWPLMGEASYWLIGGVAWIIRWIIKADTIKYRMTRDPRDHPIRKWCTFKNVRRRKFMMVKKESNPSNNRKLITTACPSCDALHGFEETDKDDRICSHDGCQEVVRAPHR